MDAGARGPRRSGWVVLRLAVLALAGVASTGTAYAVPTPDVVVGIINLLPLLTGAGVTAGGSRAAPSSPSCHSSPSACQRWTTC